MIGTGYAIADFVPFTAEVYFRLLERAGENVWPLHAPALLVGLAAIALAWRGRQRAACALLAGPWAWVGIAFLGRQYAELNWAGTWFAAMFVVQAGVLAVLSATGAGVERAARRPTMARYAGLALAGFGVAVYPAIAPLAGHGAFHAETFGIHADPTAVATLGIALLALRGPWLWLAMAIPVLWCLVTGLTLQALGAGWTAVPFAVVAIVVAIVATMAIAGAAAKIGQRTID